MKVLVVPLGFVRPFKGQPRKQFPKKDLRELSESIVAVGQIVPAIAKRVSENRWELIDGERRWQACKIAGVDTLRIVERDVADEAEQFRLSVAANFGRSDHTPLEIAHAVHTLRDSGMTFEAVAGVFGKSISWCHRYEKLVDLCPEVVQMLDAEDGDAPRISATAAMRIAELPHNLQIKVARKAAANGYGVYEINRLVRRTAKDHGLNVGVQRSPSEDWEVLVQWLHRTYREMQPFLQMSDEELQTLFTGRTDLQLQRFQSFPERISGEFSMLSEFLEKKCQQTLRKRSAISRSAE